MPILYQTYVRRQLNLHTEEFTRPRPRPPGAPTTPSSQSVAKFSRRSASPPKPETINNLVNTIHGHGPNTAHLARWELLVEWPELAADARPRRRSGRSAGCHRQAR